MIAAAAVLAHQHSVVQIVDQVPAQYRQLGERLFEDRPVPIGGFEKRHPRVRNTGAG